MSKKINISYKLFFTLAVIYLALPVVIFFLGYLKLVFGLIFTAIVAAAAVLAIRDCTKDPDGNKLVAVLAAFCYS